MEIKKLHSPKLFTIRAYCSDCHKLLMESVALSKRELMASWDKAVIDACGIQCKDCNHKVPNFSIDLRIYNSGSRIELKPEKFFPKPKAPFPTLPEEMLEAIKKE